MQQFPLDRTELRENFAYFLKIPTRWRDHDEYRHVNNALYHTFFEQLIMHYLTVAGDVNTSSGAFRCFTVENLCRYHLPIRFPETIEAGLRLGKLGNSSVRYEIGLFVEGQTEVAATGYFVDVFVDAETETPTPIPDEARACLEKLIV